MNALTPLPTASRERGSPWPILAILLHALLFIATPAVVAQETGDPLAGRRIISLAVHPDQPQRVMAGTLNSPGSGVVALSEDYGRSWRDVTPPVEGSGASFSALVVDPLAPDRFWAADAVAGRLWRSDDAGATWQSLPALAENLGSGAGIGALLADVGLTGTVLWAGTSLNGVWRSDDLGQTWQPVNGGLVQPGSRIVRALASTPDGRIIAGTHAGVFILPPEGESWQAPAQPLPAGSIVLTVAADAAAPDAVLYAGTSDRGVWRSADGGQTWAGANSPDLPAGAFISFMATALGPDRQPVVVVGTNVSGFRTANAGVSWQVLQRDGQPWTFGADALAAVGSLVYAGTNGQGVLTSFDAGQSWQAGLAIQPPTPSPTPSPVATTTPTNTPTRPATATPTPMPTPTPTSTASPTARATATPTAIPSPTPTPLPLPTGEVAGRAATAQPPATPEPAATPARPGRGSETRPVRKSSPVEFFAVPGPVLCIAPPLLLLLLAAVLGLSIAGESPRRRGPASR